ncbi:MAG: energy transducer TonB, partial [bacterium]
KKIQETRKYNPVPAYKLGKMPRFKKRVTPEYPPALKEEGVEGQVIMKIGIDLNGKIKSIEILEADHPLFIKYAVSAMKKTEFFPAELEDGSPVDTKVEIPIKFELEL